MAASSPTASPEALRAQARERSLEEAFVKIIGAATVEGLA